MLMNAFSDNILTVIPFVLTLQSQPQALRHSENTGHQTCDSNHTAKSSNGEVQVCQTKFLN